MDFLELILDSIGLVVAGLVGRQLVVLALKQRRFSLDAGLDWPFEGAISPILRIRALGLGFLVFLLILIAGWEITLIGVPVGILIGFLTRNIWKIDTSVEEMPESKYEGD